MGASAAALLFVASCYGYRAVSFERKIVPVHSALIRDRAVDGQAEGPGAKKAAIRFTVFRYLALVRTSSPAADINNRAVVLAGQSRYGEADILLREAIAEDAGMAAAYNNLGVVCELTGKRDEAFNRYSAACLRERDNAVFRNNFRGFADSGTGVK
jgi:hypothetical protein